MSEMFSFDEVEFFTVGTLGPKGQREFYLQSRGEGRLVSFKIEKGQVAALARYFHRVLQDLPPADDDSRDSSPADLDLREPVVAEFTVGDLAVAYASDVDRLVILIDELVLPDDAEGIVEDPDRRRARFVLRRRQVAQWVAKAQAVVAAGRTPCGFCGMPMEPRHGGWCACSN